MQTNSSNQVLIRIPELSSQENILPSSTKLFTAAEYWHLSKGFNRILNRRKLFI